MYVWWNSLDREGQLQPGEIFTEMHPIEWLIEERKNHSKEEMTDSKHIAYEYWLLGWKDVSEELYLKLKDEIG